MDVENYNKMTTPTKNLTLIRNLCKLASLASRLKLPTIVEECIVQIHNLTYDNKHVHLIAENIYENLLKEINEKMLLDTSFDNINS